MSQRTEGDLQFILPKKGSATLSVHKEDSAKITKTIDLLVEDFQEKLNDALDRYIVNSEDFITSPTFLIGAKPATVGIILYGFCPLSVFVCVGMEDKDDLNSIVLTGHGHCGNLTLTLGNETEWSLYGREHVEMLKLGSIDELKEAMNTSGNHRLDLQVTVTSPVTRGSYGDEDQWIIPRKKPRLSDKTLMSTISEDEDFTDFTLESEEGAKFPCHRNVLAAQSSVLRGMFLSPMEERETSRLKMTYKADIVRKFLKFFYKRKLEEEEAEGNLISLLELSEKYDLPHLKEEVEELAIRKMTVVNMVDMFLQADLHSAPKLRIAAEVFIRTNRMKVKEDFDELFKLEKDQLKKIMSICIV